MPLPYYEDDHNYTLSQQDVKPYRLQNIHRIRYNNLYHFYIMMCFFFLLIENCLL
ncbi:hypothetical protein HMPREF1860_00381 [Prevotella amnii]|uniref:Uncharacterized protein n=1 Tax=Prevotella amnii TaxID=419005 RepID=A0A134BJH2_9BACT|nr:hypothetical protein HMPREF1860_00381 [Prevotella amnii]